MDRWGRGLALVALALAAAPALGQPEAPWVDETYTVLALDNERVRIGDGYGWKYRPQAKLRLYGSGLLYGDAVTLKLVRGRRTLGEYRCPLQVDGGVGTTSLSQCWHRHDATLDVHGEIDVQLVYTSDTTDRSDVIHTFRVRVGRYWQVEGRDAHSAKYQVLTDDLLGLSWLWRAEPEETEKRGKLYFYFWAALAEDASSFPEASLRCEVGGTRVPIEASTQRSIHESLTRIEARDQRWVRGGQQQIRDYDAHLIWVKPRFTWVPPGVEDDPADQRVNIGDYPGEWTCSFRSEGRPVRTWRFTVDAEGGIPEHAVQQGEGALRLRPGAIFLETEFPRESPREFTFQPAVLRRQVAFGHRWPDAAALRGMLSALPPARGESAPARAPRGR
ncbi:MAG: hypothetical protein AAGH15_01405 [Myxococcota bacterium]